MPRDQRAGPVREVAQAPVDQSAAQVILEYLDRQDHREIKVYKDLPVLREIRVQEALEGVAVLELGVSLEPLALQEFLGDQE